MDTISDRKRDSGTAYGRKAQSHDPVLTEVGPGTPCGEFMRRYWHPVAAATNVTARPQKVRSLGEDLILFRDRKGRPGLLYPRCMHRGTTLFYGKVEDEGIRCCYHGWLFGVDGHLPRSALRTRAWPPSRRRHANLGTRWKSATGWSSPIWARRRKSLYCTRWDVLEDVESTEKIWASGASTGAGGDHTVEIVPCNWLQDWENIMDPFHLPILHTNFSGTQFVPEFGIMPTVTWNYEPFGMRYTAYRKLDDGREVDRVTLALFPHVRIVPSVELKPGPATGIGWVVPVDDTHFRLFHAVRVPLDFVPREFRAYDGRLWSELSDEEHQRFPGDWEAQVGQGAISFHSEETLASSDRAS